MTTKEDAAKYKEDVAKYYCALGSRSIRRVAAEAYNARESDPAALVAIMAELTQAVKWQQMAALASFDHHFDDEQEEKTIAWKHGSLRRPAIRR